MGTAGRVLANSSLCRRRRCWVGVARLFDTFHQPLQRPDSVGMRTAARKAAVVARVRAKHCFGVPIPALVREARVERRARRMHRGPGLDVVAGVVARDREAKTAACAVVVPRPVLHLARRHRLRDAAQAANGVAEGDRVVGNGAARIFARRAADAGDGCRMVAGEGRAEAAVEPTLRCVRARRNPARPGSGVDVVAHMRCHGAKGSRIMPARGIRRPWRPGPMPGSVRMSHA